MLIIDSSINHPSRNSNTTYNSEKVGLCLSTKCFDWSHLSRKPIFLTSTEILEYYNMEETLSIEGYYCKVYKYHSNRHNLIGDSLKKSFHNGRRA